MRLKRAIIENNFVKALCQLYGTPPSASPSNSKNNKQQNTKTTKPTPDNKIVQSLIYSFALVY